MNKEEMYTLLENNLIEHSIDFLKQVNINLTKEEARKLVKNIGVNIAIEDGDLEQR